jgi:hypothetical protein
MRRRFTHNNVEYVCCKYCYTSMELTRAENAFNLWHINKVFNLKSLNYNLTFKINNILNTFKMYAFIGLM